MKTRIEKLKAEVEVLRESRADTQQDTAAMLAGVLEKAWASKEGDGDGES